ncbi:undecaprenyl-diphosphate phosphatase [Alphaproteobacteria bacterium]|jgi:undecaprenyl-diphosphatase|nr:undecaprenyl-diphosphate phosphatase [Alphaproteobacteria bacterium]MBT5798515.1 undecaprenyl-diphosphate phosphatase [Alphaproteobacteria bacterium]MDA9189858.1 undecaprenyl-diphosphate phosphatase [Alphaproteobacteria bacterium]MDA9815951.1 undecaprenyl-diphosphate phosphatase [Alphaproteobacteria bacterium]
MDFSLSEIFYLVLLAIIQGITEFLPVSSSGHLILLPKLINHADHGLSIDVAAHLGTLVAVLIYVRAELRTIVGAIKNLILKKLNPNISISDAQITSDTQSLKLLKLIIIATIPVIIAGFFISLFEPSFLRLIQTVALANLVFAAFLWHSDTTSKTDRKLSDLRIKDALIIGCAQMLALIPGTSRSGITMTLARYLEFERISAARFSLLLAIPVIIAAGFLQMLKLYRAEDALIGISALLVAVLSCIIALLAVHGMMRWIQRADFRLFVYYRIALGLLLLAVSF